METKEHHTTDKSKNSTSNPVVQYRIRETYIGSIPGVVLGLFLGYGFNCGYVILFWIGGCASLPVVAMALSFIISKVSKNTSKPIGMIVSGIGGFIIGLIVGYMGLPAAC